MKSPTPAVAKRQLATIVSVLRRARLDQRLTQRDVAAALGLKSHGIICRLERGRARKHGMYAAFLVEWAHVVGCDVGVRPRSVRDRLGILP